MIAEMMPHRSSPAEGRAARSGPIGRARRILGTSLTYVDHPSFRDPTARDAILTPLTDPGDDPSSWPLPSAERHPPSPAGRSRTRVLSREQEAHLFRKMNYLKWRAHWLEQRLDPDRPDPGDLDEIERLQSQALAVKNRIVELNLGLVVSIARTRVRAGYDLSDCVSDGNLALILAVDGFDFARGNRFSTYATWAIRNELARQEKRAHRRRRQPFALYGQSLAAPEAVVDESEREEAQDRRRQAVLRWLARLDPRERRVLASRYGIGGAPAQSLSQIGQELGITKERVRQIVDRAQARIRKFARLESLEPLAI
jgi:RNA polymerase primary sigma factor